MIERCRVSCHDFGTTLRATFIEYLMQNCLLLIPVAIIGSFGCYYQILLLISVKKHVVRWLWQLVHCYCGCRTTVNLLKKVVLLLAHHLVASCLLFASFQLVLETLCIDSDPRVANDLLSCISCDSTTTSCSQLTHPLQAWIERQQVVLQVYYLHIRFRQGSWDHVVDVQAFLVRYLLVFFACWCAVTRGRSLMVHRRVVVLVADWVQWLIHRYNHGWGWGLRLVT